MKYIEKLLNFSYNWYKENNIDKKSYLKGFCKGYKKCLQDMKDLIDKSIENL